MSDNDPLYKEYKRVQNEIWLAGYGKRYRLREMTDEHLHRSIRYLQNNLEDLIKHRLGASAKGLACADDLKELREENERRNLCLIRRKKR